MVLSRLNFHITVPLEFIMPHIESLMISLDTTLPDILGEESYKAYEE